MAQLQKVEWSKKQKDNFRSWIYEEIQQTLGDRSGLEQKWLNLISQHRARVVGDGTADEPFIGASDLEFPLTATHFEPVYADLIQTLHVPRDFWTVEALRSDTVDLAKPYQEFLSVVERKYLKMRQVNKKAFLDKIIFGTTIYKDYIHHHATTRRDYDDDGTIRKIRKVDFSPRVEHIPIQDFFIPAYASDIDPDAVGGAPWVSHRFELTVGQFKARAEGSTPFQANYDPKEAENILKYVHDDREDVIKERVRQEDRYQPFQDNKIRLHEVWARYDVDGDGMDEDVVVTWHHESRSILRTTYTPFLHGKRPFHSATYIPSFGFYGVGLGEADEWSQIAMTRLLNNAINNTLLANTRMYGVPMGTNISPDEPIFPGKQWMLGTNEQIQEVKLGEVYPSMFNMLQMMMQWSEQRTTVSELRQGDISQLPSRTPASSVMSILREGNKKFDMMLSNLRDDALSPIGSRVSQNLVQISRDDPRWVSLAMQVLGPDKGSKVARILQGQVHDITDKFGIAVTATSALVNKEVERQAYMGLAQVISQTYPILIQYAQAQGDQQLMAQTLQASYTGTLEILQRLLESFDIKNVEEFVPVGMSSQPGPGAAAPAGAPLGGTSGPGPFAQGENPLSAILGLG